MHAGLFDVFHDAANQHHFAVTDCVHIDFNCIVEEAIQQNCASLDTLTAVGK
ncbi:hypothetical protein ACNKHO_00280 [Shigella flexneri]